MRKCLFSWGLAIAGLTFLGGEATAQKPTSRPAAKAPTAKTSHKTKANAQKKSLRTLPEFMALLEQEMARNWAFISKQKNPGPYYMVYALQRNTRVSVSAKDGVLYSVTNSKKSPSYRLNVRLRVGDHKLDNTGRDGYDWRAFQHMLPVPYSLPLKPDAKTLRKHLWQITDRRFQEGMATYHRKRYVRSLKVEIKDKSGDFSKEKPVKLTQLPPPLHFNTKKWKAIAKKVSAFSRTNLSVIDATVSIAASQDAQVIVASDGSRIIKHKTLYMYTVHLTYLSPKQEYLDNVRLAYYDKEEKLPDEAKLTKIIKQTLQELIDQGAAIEGEPSEAPAILLPDVAGVLFHEALGHRLEAERMLNESDGRTFRRKIGMKVIPTFLTVFDDPTLPHWLGTPLNGHYLVDDQNVRSSRVVLIQDGILRGFLMSRKPIDNFKYSNGHGRGLFGRPPFSRMGNLLVESKRKFSPTVLRKMLIEEARRQGKPYGYIMSRSSGGYTHTGTYGIQSFKNRPIVVFRVDAKTGKQDLVKGLEMIGTPLTVVNNIMATGTDYGVFNGFCGAESGYVPVSAIAPSVLLKTVELQRVKITQKKGFLLPPPFSNAKKSTTKTPKTAKAAPNKPVKSALKATAPQTR